MNDRAEYIRRLKENARKPVAKLPYRIPKISAKKQAKMIEEKEGVAELWSWFEDRRREMKGVCLHCQGVTQKKDDKTFHYSIAHILPKNLFESVKMHPLNWIELCYYGESCHTNVDNHIIDLTDLHCWDTVVERFVSMYPDIAKEERKYIPDALLQYIKNERDL